MTRVFAVILMGLGIATLGLLVAAAPVPLRVPPLPQVDKLAHKSYDEKLTDKVRFTMVAVPGGTFLMGSPDNEKGRKKDEGPRHPVTVRPFWMGKCEVTWDEYDLWSKRNAEREPPKTDNDKKADAVTRPSPSYVDETYGHGHDGYPVLNITHHAAMEYCRWLSAKTGKLYRLPTEAEWEWACRAGTTTAYSFGDDPRALGDYGWFADNSEDASHPVGRKKPNPWGLNDMHGLVAEWCLDHYQADYYAHFPLGKATLMPLHLPTQKRWPHVARGGSWLDGAALCRSAARRASDASWQKREPQRPLPLWWLTDAEFVGFRVVRAVDELDALRLLRSKVTLESK